ncbi:cation:proton antiporter [Rhodanobacter spathiphylli]|uniref:NhaP-type Na+(K+)/H+ antiporter n=1 Tax=Rhodanobacter spathiphylli B39 TaxID=1163407 RepID=I4W181_9GAMM|nr:sodium:proton antiporter [Rhodanobacter spathiphylli]EIL93222.1 NhaP-type Na+(K+)/H+ antiporter [Rhodanobacter spathiphylli B39]
MNLLGWTASIGFLLLLMSLASGWIRHLPVTTFSLYLAAGVVAGPWCLKLLDIELTAHAHGIARLTEIALVVSLFMTGLKLRLDFSDPSWRTAARLALPAMVLTVAGAGVVAHWLFALSWPLAMLIGAILAPTDPVLASMVAVDDASDRDRLRLALSGEAGLNDGTALPFVVLALLLLGDHGSATALGRWLGLDFAWPLVGGLGIGFALGWMIGWIGVRMKTASADVTPNDFLALALMALSYAAATALSASGFLAAFAAGLGLRHVELHVVRRHPNPDLDQDDQRGTATHPPAEVLIDPRRRNPEQARKPVASMGMVVSDALSFGDALERLIAAALVFLLGAAFANHWHPAATLLALLLFAVVRPLAIWLATIGSQIPRSRRLLLGWFGIRGIGSLNYLAYAATHGLGSAATSVVAEFVITTVVLSIVLHGITTPPLMAWRQAGLHRRSASRSVNTARKP